MNYLVSIFLFLISIQYPSAQNIAEKAYASVINDGPSTAPEFVVVTIINSNTGESKEIMFSVNQLFECLELELNEHDQKKIKKYLLSKSSDRTFAVKRSETLNTINFEKYQVKKGLLLEKKIDQVIIKNHLIDSLSKIDTIRKNVEKLFDVYYMLRREILKTISDSIAKVRPINKKEKTMLLILKDPYYDGHEEQCEKLPGDSKEDSASRKKILQIWDNKINLYKSDRDRYIYMDNESTRCEKKFFRAYYKKYRLTFCKVLFKYGAVCYFGDENPIVGFAGVLK